MRTLLLLAFIAACGGKAPSPTTPGNTTTTTTPATGPAATRADALAITSDDDYVAKANVLVDELIAMLRAGGTNCDKLAADFEALQDQIAPTLRAMEKYEADHPGANERIDQKMLAREQELDATFDPVMKACGEHPGFRKALERMAQGGR